MTTKQKAQEPFLNNFFIINKHTADGFDQLCGKIREIKTRNKKVCYVCLSKPYTDILDCLKEEHLSNKEVIFIDALSSSQYPLEPVQNCVFVRGMENLKEMVSAVKRAVRTHDCGTVVFDSISALLVYQPADAIVKFTHNLLSDETCKDTKKIYISLNERGILKDESKKLINDLNLFADSIIELRA